MVTLASLEVTPCIDSNSTESVPLSEMRGSPVSLNVALAPTAQHGNAQVGPIECIRPLQRLDELDNHLGDLAGFQLSA